MFRTTVCVLLVLIVAALGVGCRRSNPDQAQSDVQLPGSTVPSTSSLAPAPGAAASVSAEAPAVTSDPALPGSPAPCGLAAPPSSVRSEIRDWLSLDGRNLTKLAQSVKHEIDACRRAGSFTGSFAEMKSQSAKENQCVRLRVEAEARALQQNSLEPSHLLSLRRDFIKNLCDLTEEAQWVDFANNAQLMQGSMHEFTFLGCTAGSYDEQMLLLRSIREGDFALVAERIRAIRPLGAHATRLLECRSHELRTLPEPPQSDEECFLACPLRGPPRKKLIKLFDDVLKQARTLADETCSTGTKLRTTFGDDCSAALVDYFTHVYYERIE